MFVSELNFKNTLNWFYSSDYKYLLLFVSSFAKNEEEYIKKIIDERTRIDALTGSNICFFIFAENHYIEAHETCSFLKNATADMIYSNIKSISGMNFSKDSVYNGYGLSASIAVSIDVCKELNIRLSQLPAFLLVSKSKETVLFSTKSPEDLEDLLSVLRFLNRYTDDYKYIKNEKCRINSLPSHEQLKDKLEVINKKRDALLNSKLLYDKYDNEFNSSLQQLFSFFETNELNNKALNTLIIYNPSKIRKYMIEGIEELSKNELKITRTISAKKEFNGLNKKIKYYAAKRVDVHLTEKINAIDNEIKTLEDNLSLFNDFPDYIDHLIMQNELELNTLNNNYAKSLKQEFNIDIAYITHCLESRISPIPYLIKGLNENRLQIKILNSAINPIIVGEQYKIENIDIFISAKSEDYNQARLIYHFLLDNGYHPFLADDSIRKAGKDDYGSIIDSAIDSCSHLIVYASKLEYISSTYVQYEWRLFSEEIKTGRKNGNLLTILTENIDIKDLPILLRNRQSVKYWNYEKILLSFLK
jgi:hypothetical protein